MRKVTRYQATANSTGVRKVQLRVEDGWVVGEGDHLSYHPPIPVRKFRESWVGWNMRVTRAAAVNLYRRIEQERIDKASAALAALDSALPQESKP